MSIYEIHSARGYIRVVAGVALGVLAGACLPTANDGERGAQCWTEQASRQHGCNVDAIRCIDDTEAGDFDAFFVCTDEADRCSATVTDNAEQCERRTGCIAALSGCLVECDRLLDQLQFAQCQQTCDIDFERCSPWYEPGCEQRCLNEATECVADSLDADDTIDCEDDRLGCVLECY